MFRQLTNYTTLSIVAILISIAGYCYWKHESFYPSTDDAYISAHEIDMATQISGKIDQVFVHNQKRVTKNELLFTIDQTPFEIAYQKAQANLQNTQLQLIADENAVKAAAAQLAEQQAQLIDIKKKYVRMMALVKKGYVSKASGDDMTRELTVAQQAVILAKNNLAEVQAKRGIAGNNNAQLKLAKAAVDQAKLNLHYTKVFSPSNGTLAQFTLRPGQTVTAYQALFTIVDDHRWWAIANMKETDLQRIRAGQKAIVSVDMYSSHQFDGVVKSIAAGSGASFDLLPPENATGNWVKVTQRFPVRIEIINPTAQYPLRIGASCTVTIDTKSHA